jgi:hypothetical protein
MLVALGMNSRDQGCQGKWTFLVHLMHFHIDIVGEGDCVLWVLKQILDIEVY